MLLKIGELAKRIGLTVRALHHYDAIGLVHPSGRSDAGYRLYDRGDIARLHRIQALRGLGLTLAEIQAMLDGHGADLRVVIQQQMAALDRDLVQAQDLKERLASLDEKLATQTQPDLDEWLTTLGLMATQRKYFSNKEIEALFERRIESDQPSPWPHMVARVRQLMDLGIAPNSSEAKALGLEWMDLCRRTMSDDPRFLLKLTAMHRNEFIAQTLTGVDGPLLDYIGRAAFENRCDVYANYVTARDLENYRAQYHHHIETWLSIFADARQLYEQGVPPEDPDAQALFQRWQILFQQCWGNNPDTREKVLQAHREHPEVLLGTGLDTAMQEFVNRGMHYLVHHTPTQYSA